MYSSIPYLTSLNESHSASVLWVNSAHTYVGLNEMDGGRYIDFVSESGALELFVFASASNGKTNRMKKI